MKKLLLLLGLFSTVLYGQLNETELSSYVQGLTAVHTETAYKYLMDDVVNESMVKKKDVINTRSVVSSSTLDFSLYDAIESTQTTTGLVTYTISGLENGQVGYLVVSKFGVATVAFSNGNLLYPEYSSDYGGTATVVFKIINKAGDIYIIPQGDDLLIEADETYKGVVEKATTAEAQAGTADKYLDAELLQDVTATSLRAGIQRNANSGEAEDLLANDITITPATLPISSTSQKGLIETATKQQAIDGEDTETATTPEGVKASVEGILESEQDWTSLTFTNLSGWAVNDIEYCIKNNGIVRLRIDGLSPTASGHSMTGIITTIPSDYAPGIDLNFAIVASDLSTAYALHSSIIITTSGSVYLYVSPSSAIYVGHEFNSELSFSTY